MTDTSKSLDKQLDEIIELWGMKSFEPATGTRGQGGLPRPGTVTDWKLTISKDGWNFHKDELKTALKKLINEAKVEELWKFQRENEFKYPNPSKDPFYEYSKQVNNYLIDRINSLKEGRE